MILVWKNMAGRGHSGSSHPFPILWPTGHLPPCIMGATRASGLVSARTDWTPGHSPVHRQQLSLSWFCSGSLSAARAAVPWVGDGCRDARLWGVAPASSKTGSQWRPFSGFISLPCRCENMKLLSKHTACAFTSLWFFTVVMQINVQWGSINLLLWTCTKRMRNLKPHGVD